MSAINMCMYKILLLIQCGMSGKVGNYMTKATTSCKMPPKSHKFKS